MKQLIHSMVVLSSILTSVVFAYPTGNVQASPMGRTVLSVSGATCQAYMTFYLVFNDNFPTTYYQRESIYGNGVGTLYSNSGLIGPYPPATNQPNPYQLPFTVPANTVLTYQVLDYIPTFPIPTLVGASTLAWNCSTSAVVQGGTLFNFTDGRCNQEPWQSFAVYPDGKGGFIFYAIYQGVGYYGMHVTKAFLDKNPDTGFNHIIAQSQGIHLWRLAGGLLQAHRIGMNNKDYWFNLDSCDSSTTPNSAPTSGGGY